ncbi:MAG: DUF2723 domain-containing protein [bacterium]
MSEQSILSSASSPVNPRVHRYVAAGVLLISLVMYFSTIAPTTSFWDCGEFIACSYTLSVPHPPGAPFFLLLGRLFSMIVPLPDIGLRVNTLSALVSAFTVLLTYLVIVRLTRRWLGREKSVQDQIVLYGSGAIGAIAFAASHSFWFNAVEAEVYAISMFFTALVVWLAVRWMDNSDDPESTRYLLLIAYFVGLATGVHLLNVLALSPIVMLIYFQKYKFGWKSVIVALGVSFIAILVVYPGLVSGIPRLLRGGIYDLVLLLVLAIVAFVLAVRYRRSMLAVVLASVLLVVVGYSTYLVVYVRANENLIINENQPDTVERLISYLNREQYGQVGPVEIQNVSPSVRARMRNGGALMMSLGGNKVLRFHILERKAPLWKYQLNRMYIRYLAWQYFIGEHGEVLIFPFILGLMGMLWHFWRDWKRASVVGLLFLMTGLAVIIYLNQEDPQPRERDYAYVGSFFAYAIWVGMGVAALVEFVGDFFRKRSPAVRGIVSIAVVVLMVLAVPVNMLAQNYHTHKRSGNYVAWDYSHNMLESCEPHSIIFTNGDNDTFPVWYLQVVEKVRPDVRVVNLSLLNTDWYIKQLRDDEPRVPVAFSDRDIDMRLTARTDEALLLRYWPKDRREWKITTLAGDMKWEVPATMYIPTGLPNETAGDPNFLRIQDIMVLHIIEQNKWKQPIYFAVTVSQQNMLGLGPWLSMEGLVFRLHSEKAPSVDMEKMKTNLFETYDGHYRNLDNPKVFLFDNIVTLLQNYRSAFLQLAFSYYREAARTHGEVNASSGIPREQWEDRFDELSPNEKALLTLQKMNTIMPPDAIETSNLAVAGQVGRLFAELGDNESAKTYFSHGFILGGKQKDPEGQMQMAYFTYEFGGDSLRALEMVGEVLKGRPTARALFAAAAVYNRMNDEEAVNSVLDMLQNREGLSLRDQLELANFYYSKNRYRESEALYRQLLVTQPRNPEVYGGLVNVYEASGDTSGLIEVLQSWLQINPRDEEARKLLFSYGGQVSGTP